MCRWACWYMGKLYLVQELASGGYIGCRPIAKLFMSSFTVLLKGVDRGKHNP